MVFLLTRRQGDMTKKLIIYKITNLFNSKIYIGQDSQNNSNYFGSGQTIKKAVRKYGKKFFTKEILEICKSKTELDDKEKFWIKYYNSTNPKIGYNLAEGGGGTLGYKKTKQQLINVSRATKGKPKPKQSEIRRRLFQEGKLISPCKGKTKKDDIIKKMQTKRNKTMLQRYGNLFGPGRQKGKQWIKGHIPWNKGKKGFQAWNKDKKLSEKHIENLKISHTGLKRTKESIKKQFETRAKKRKAFF